MSTEPPVTSGIVYIVQATPGNIDTPWVKVGYSGSIDAVIKRYTTPYGGAMRVYYWSVEDGRKEEGEVHGVLATHKLSREVFSATGINAALEFARGRGREIYHTTIECDNE